MITDFLQVNIDKKKFENEYIKQLEQKIKEQQKEIEEISREELNTIISCIDKHYISKDRIREKIYELEKDVEIHSIYEENWNKINVLKELLEE